MPYARRSAPISVPLFLSGAGGRASVARKPFLDLEKIAPLPDLGGLDAAAPFAKLRRLERGGARFPLERQRQENARLRRSERAVRIGRTADLDRHAEHAIDPPGQPLLPSFRLLARPRQLGQGERPKTRRRRPSRRSALAIALAKEDAPMTRAGLLRSRFAADCRRIRARVGSRPSACRATTASRIRCWASTTSSETRNWASSS